MKVRAICFFCCLMGFVSWEAQALGPTICKLGRIERMIEIIPLREGSRVPCEVKYHRENAKGEIVVKILYKAQTRDGFCETKATEFAGQLAMAGWSCSQADRARKQY